MPSYGAHLTNLESDEHIASLGNPSMLERHNATKEYIRQEYGDFLIGPPKATKQRSKEDLTKRGIVGLYKRP